MDLSNPNLINDDEGDRRKEAAEQQEADIAARIEAMWQNKDDVCRIIAENFDLLVHAEESMDVYDQEKEIEKIITRHMRIDVESELGIE